MARSNEARDEEWGEDEEWNEDEGWSEDERCGEGKPRAEANKEDSTILLGHVQPVFPNTCHDARSPPTSSSEPHSLARLGNWLRWTDQDSHEAEHPRHLEPSGDKREESSILVVDQYPSTNRPTASSAAESQDPSGQKSKQGSILALDLECGATTNIVKGDGNEREHWAPSRSNRLVLPVHQDASILVPPRTDKDTLVAPPPKKSKSITNDANRERTIAVAPMIGNTINTEGSIAVPPMMSSRINTEGTIAVPPMKSSRTNMERTIEVPPMGNSVINTEASVAVAPMSGSMTATDNNNTFLPSSSSRAAPEDSVLFKNPVEASLQEKIREALKSPQERKGPRMPHQPSRRHNISHVVYGVYLMALLVIVGAVILAVFLTMMPKESGSDRVDSPEVPGMGTNETNPPEISGNETEGALPDVNAMASFSPSQGSLQLSSTLSPTIRPTMIASTIVTDSPTTVGPTTSQTIRPTKISPNARTTNPTTEPPGSPTLSAVTFASTNESSRTNRPTETEEAFPQVHDVYLDEIANDVDGFGSALLGSSQRTSSTGKDTTTNPPH